jgi:hypothetical protein
LVDTDMVSRLQALLQTGRIVLPKTSEADALARELLDYELGPSTSSELTSAALGCSADGQHERRQGHRSADRNRQTSC